MAALTAGHWALLAFFAFVFMACALVAAVALIRFAIKRKAVVPAPLTAGVATKLEPYTGPAPNFAAAQTYVHPSRAHADFIENLAKDRAALADAELQAAYIAGQMMATRAAMYAPIALPSPTPTTVPNGSSASQSPNQS